MKPKFKTLLAWEQAQALMQPAFIRVIDNIRKELDNTPWQGTYQESQSPYPGYQLHLTQQNQSIVVDIWDLCYEVCFLNYDSTLKLEKTVDFEVTQEVEIDTSLIDETGEVDWQALETKAQRVVKYVFASLPAN